MPIRNPFKRGTAGLDTTEEIPPNSLENAGNGFQKTNVVGAKPIDIKEPVEYKLSGKIVLDSCRGVPRMNQRLLLTEINDSGVFLPVSYAQHRRSYFGPASCAASANAVEPSHLLQSGKHFGPSAERPLALPIIAAS